jgi:type VI secretion system secreted protein Hcp
MTLRGLRPVFGACLLCGLLALVPDSADAQAIYLELSPDVPGEATAEGFEGWIEITSMGHDVTRTSAISRPQFSLLSLTKRTDRASPALWRRAIMATALQEARLVAVDDDGEMLFEIQLQNVVVMSYSQGGAGGRASEQFTLSFAQISFAYYPPDGGGTIVTCWDLETEVGC